jgi:Raf kinase inhibitor-like YbhB/YbcL family protein
MRAPLVLALALAAAGPARAAELTVASPAFAAGAAIPSRYALHGGNHSPPLRWAPAPGARAYAVTMRDPDAPGEAFTHWLVWNLPAGVTALAEDGAAGAPQGRNDDGGRGYSGPHPPSGRHHYHLRVIALDAPLKLAVGADFAAFDAAARDHVLASGELVGTYAAP